MWILYTHLAVSVICIAVSLMSIAFVSPEKKEYITTYQKGKTSKLSFLRAIILCLIPVINVISTAIVFYTAVCPLEDYIKLSEKTEKNAARDKEVLEQYKQEHAA